jgi:antitoxin component of MazEF toxin-antitoxin module
MKPLELKVARIGNSRGVRLPAATLERYHIGDTVVMEERTDGILLRPRGRAEQKLSWDETAEAMAASREAWLEWDALASDGLDDTPWETRRPKRGAEPPSEYKKTRAAKKPSRKQ